MKPPTWCIKHIHRSKIHAVKIVNWSDHSEIATIPHVYSFNGEDSDGRKAAELIAAAPEMLEALKKANANIEQLCSTVNVLAGFRKVRAEDFAEEVRAAIAKATI